MSFEQILILIYISQAGRCTLMSECKIYQNFNICYNKSKSTSYKNCDNGKEKLNA